MFLYYNYSSEKRNLYIDTIKGVAIILVVIGHCIQFGSGADILESGFFFKDTLFKFIYSFHMPLFMLVSGYLYANTTKRNTIQILKRKSKSILLPLIIWQTINICINFLLGQEYSINILFLSYFHAFWFLRALFFCCMIVLLMNRLFNDNIYSYLVLIIILHFIPNSIIPNIFVFTFFYFAIGYFVKKKNKLAIITPSKIEILFTISITAFFILLIYFKDSFYVYNSYTCIINSKYSPEYMLYINIYRHLTATTGCIVVLTIIHFIYQRLQKNIIKTLTALGEASLCIYTINSLINEHILLSLPFTHINYILTITESIIIICISYSIYKLLKSNKTTSYLFLGGR